MTRIVMKPRGQITVLIVVFGLFALIGTTYFTNGNVGANRDWFGVSLGCALTIGGAIGIWRSLRLGVVIDEAGVRIRSLDKRDKVTPWRDVEAIDCERVEVRAGMLLYAPVLHLDGDSLPLMVLGSYAQSGAEAHAAKLRILKDAAPPSDKCLTDPGP